LRFARLGVSVEVRCADPEVRRLLAEAYGQSRGRGASALRYRIESVGGTFRLTRRGMPARRAAGAGPVFGLLDSDLAVQLQRRRRELLFLHAAVLVRGGRAALLVGASGAGKSTAAWALAHHGFRYGGDELAPVDVKRLRVIPSPRALCLKAPPPAPYPLPARARCTRSGWHVPLRDLPGGLHTAPAPIAAVFFVDHAPAAAGRGLRRLSAAEAAARLYAQALNPLAHPDDGLEPAVRLAEALPAFALDSSRLPAACRRVAARLDAAAAPGTAKPSRRAAYSGRSRR
jgi:hypothetical protein